MVLRFLSWIPLRPRDSPPPTSHSQGGSSNGANADAGRKMKEVDNLLAKLEKEGVETDGKIVSIIDDGIARIKAEAARENINKLKRDDMELLHTIRCIAVGFLMGAELYEYAFHRALREKR